MRILPANLGCFLSWPGCCRERGDMPDWSVPGLPCRQARLVYIDLKLGLPGLACRPASSPGLGASLAWPASSPGLGAGLALPSPPILYHNLASLLPWHLNREVVCSCCHYLWQRVMKNSLPNVFGKDHRVWAGHLGVGRLLKRFERATELWAGRLKSLSGPSSCGTAAQKSLSGPMSCGPAAQKVGSSVDLSCP